MKRFLLAILSVCCATLVYAQKPTQDVLYLKNGSVVKGTIMSWTGETVKIKTRDGSIFVYNSSDVESRKVEDVSITVTGKKILDFPKHSFGIRAGGIFSMTEREGMFVNPQHVICTGDEYTSETLQLNGVGFHIGGIYEVALTKTNRWFFQTGLDVQYINTIKKDSFIAEDYWWSEDDWDFRNITGNSLFLDIPMMFSCKFPISKDFGIYPSFGITHTIGLYSCISGERERLVYREYERTGLQSFKSVGFVDELTDNLTYGDHKPLNPYSRYRLNLKGELNFIVNKNVVLGLNASITLVDSSASSIFAFRDNCYCNLGLTLGYNF